MRNLFSRNIKKLSPGMRGMYLVTTQSSTHIWNLDDMEYTRVPGKKSRNSFAYDYVPAKITLIAKWPEVGNISCIFYDDPYDRSMEQYRISSKIKSIKKISPKKYPGVGK